MRISCEGLRLSHSHHPCKGMRREKVEQDRIKKSILTCGAQMAIGGVV
jgi:hypothetical protein